MKMLRNSLVGSLAVAFSLVPLAASADIPPEVVQRCKRATALIRVGEESEGTAFHIGNGIFITNHHVVEDAGKDAQVKLVLDAGESTQRIVSVKIARFDAEADLAMLKVDLKDLPPSLQLGDESSLVETTQVTAFGFPFGKDLAVGKNEYPTVTVTVGRITAIRKSAGKVKQIQLDAAVTVGTSGGPVVNNAGQVIGVINSGIIGVSLNFAIPINLLKAFLHGPGIVLHAPPFSTSGSAVPISIEVLNPDAQNKVDSAVLRLSSHSQDRREYKSATLTGGKFEFTAALAPALDGDTLQVDVEDPDSQWSILVRDCIVRADGRMLHLKEISEITLGLSPAVVLTSGKRLTSPVMGLKSVPTLKTGGAQIVDFSKATHLRFKPAKLDTKLVNYEIELRSGDKVVERQKGTITPDGIFPEVIVDVPSAEVVQAKPQPDGIELPAEIPAYRFARNGHYYAAIDLGEAVNWLDCNRAARLLRYKGLRGHLVTITTPEESQFVVEHFRGQEHNGYFLGAYQDKTARDYSKPAGGWRWVTGEPWNFTNWHAGEPNDVSGSNPSVLNMMPDGGWNDTIVDDGNGKGFVVEFE